MGLSIGAMHKGRQIAVMIQNQMQLDGSLGTPKVSPIKETQTEIDGRCINAIERILTPTCQRTYNTFRIR
jgi:hypothetical protein